MIDDGTMNNSRKGCFDMANKTNKNRKKTKSSTRSKTPVKEEKVLDSGIPMANEIQMIASI